MLGFYDRIPELTYFNSSDLVEVEELCPSMSPNEVLDYYALTVEDLKETSTPDLEWFNIAFKRGRTRARCKASDYLFRAMADKNGGVACVEYLARFGSEWEAPIEGTPLGNKKFSFNVVLDKN